MWCLMGRLHSIKYGFFCAIPNSGKCIDIVHIVQKNMEWNAHLQYCKQPVILGGEREKLLTLLEWDGNSSPIQRLYKPLIWGVQASKPFPIVRERPQHQHFVISNYFA